MRYVGSALAVSLLCTGLIFGGAAVGQRRFERAGPDSFLAFPVDSTDELVAVLRSDAALRRRFARHFGVSEAEAVDFIKRALIPYRLPQTRVMTVYGVTPTGRIYPVRTRMVRGTRVWATRSGEPILKWLCANPLTRTLPGVRMPAAPRTSRRRGFRGGRVAALPAKPAPFGVLAEEGIDLSAPTLVAAAEPGDLTQMSLEELMDLQFKSAPVTANAGALPRVASLSGGGLGLGALALGALGLGLSGGGGSSSVPRPAQEIPEPGTLALIAAGTAVLGATLRRRPSGARR